MPSFLTLYCRTRQCKAFQKPRPPLQSIPESLSLANCIEHRREPCGQRHSTHNQKRGLDSLVCQSTHNSPGYQLSLRGRTEIKASCLSGPFSGRKTDEGTRLLV